MTILRMIAKFFKDWFMPLPAHDAYAERNSNGPDDNAENPDSENPAEVTPKAAVHNSDIPTHRRLDAYDPENKDINAVDFSHLVRAPEGSEDRAMRGQADSPKETDENMPDRSEKLPDSEERQPAE